VALSSRSLALGVTQQVWSFGSPDFPQIGSVYRPVTAYAYSLPLSSVVFMWHIAILNSVLIFGIASLQDNFVREDK